MPMLTAACVAAELESISQAFGGLGTFAESLCHQHWLLLLVADGLGAEVGFVQPPPLVALPQPGLRRQNPLSLTQPIR